MIFTHWEEEHKASASPTTTKTGISIYLGIFFSPSPPSSLSLQKPSSNRLSRRPHQHVVHVNAGRCREHKQHSPGDVLRGHRRRGAGRSVDGRGERPRRRLFDVGLEWSHARRYRSVADTLALVESVTFDDLHRVLEAWPLDAPSATVLAGPL